MVEDEQRGRDDAREAASKAERRVGEITSELEELRSQLEQVSWVYFPLLVLAIYNLVLRSHYHKFKAEQLVPNLIL